MRKEDRSLIFRIGKALRSGFSYLASREGPITEKPCHNIRDAAHACEFTREAWTVYMSLAATGAVVADTATSFADSNQHKCTGRLYGGDQVAYLTGIVLREGRRDGETNITGIATLGGP